MGIIKDIISKKDDEKALARAILGSILLVGAIQIEVKVGVQVSTFFFLAAIFAFLSSGFHYGSLIVKKYKKQLQEAGEMWYSMATMFFFLSSIVLIIVIASYAFLPIIHLF